MEQWRRAVLMTSVWVLMLMTSGVAQAQFVPDCANPRLATETFIRNLQPDNWHPALAVTCFDFSRFVGEMPAREQVGIKLKAVLDARGHFIYYDRISDDPDYKQKETEQSQFVLFPGALDQVFLVKVGERWVYSAQTVAATSDLHHATFSLGLQGLIDSSLPSVFQTFVLGVRLWQWLALVALFVLALVMARVIHSLLIGLLRRALKDRAQTWVQALQGRMAWPTRLLIMSLLMMPILPELGLPVFISRTLVVALQMVATGAVVVVAFRLVDVISDWMAARASKTDSRLDDQLVPIVRKSLKWSMAIVGVVFTLQNFNVEVGSLLAGLGLGGLAFALAAKDTLANFFGSLMIFVDRPFQIGDWVKTSAVEGTVEEVGFRSTRVRTFYKSLVTVPNSQMADGVIDNFGERTERRFKLSLGLAYDTPPEKIQAFVEGVRAILAANPAVWDQPSNVYFYGMGATSLDVLIYTFLDVPTWGEELKARHNILLEFLRLAQVLDVSFAFPTQSIHLESTPEHPSPDSAPLTQDELSAIVLGFGPGGVHARPEGEPLTDYFKGPEETARGDSDAE